LGTVPRTVDLKGGKDQAMTDESWYAVRCLFQFPWGDPPGVYEERITLWRTGSFEEAIRRAEEEAGDYVADLGGTYVGLAQAFRLAVDGPLHDGAEVFSLMRDSTEKPASYIQRFFETGYEHQR
jgi:hypothetical protein